MITLNAKLRLSLLTLVFAALTSLSLRADDTEIYLGDIDFSTDIRPNVLFIIDTSGSMDTDVQSTTGTYDPTQTYTGSCDASRIYWDDPSMRQLGSRGCSNTKLFKYNWFSGRSFKRLPGFMGTAIHRIGHLSRQAGELQPWQMQTTRV